MMLAKSTEMALLHRLQLTTLTVLFNKRAPIFTAYTQNRFSTLAAFVQLEHILSLAQRFTICANIPKERAGDPL